jgi:hypothetical protein
LYLGFMPSKTGTPPEQQDADCMSDLEADCAPRVRSGKSSAGGSQQCDVSCSQQGSVIGCFLPTPYKAAHQEMFKARAPRRPRPPFRAGLHQQPEHIEAIVLSKRGERRDGILSIPYFNEFEIVAARSGIHVGPRLGGTP